MAQDILIKIVIKGDGPIPATLISKILNRVQSAIQKSELEMLEAIQAEFGKELPENTIRDIKNLFEKHPPEVLVIESASSGSILLFGAVLAAAYWLLDKTLGKTIEEAWPKTNLHKRIKSFLLSSTQKQAEQIARDVDLHLIMGGFAETFVQDSPTRTYANISSKEVKIEIGPPITIVVLINFESRVPPKRSIMLNGEIEEKTAPSNWAKRQDRGNERSGTA